MPDPGEILDIHIISHTHDDTGYLSTVAEYYASNVRWARKKPQISIPASVFCLTWHADFAFWGASAGRS